MEVKKGNKESKSNLLNKIYFYFFLLLPFVYTAKLIDPVLIPRQLFLTCFLFVVGLAICYQVYKNKITLNLSFLRLTLPKFFLAFIVITLASFSQSVAITESNYILSKVIIEMLFFVFTTFLIIQKVLDESYLIKSIVVFVAVSIIIAAYQLFSLNLSNVNLSDSIQLITSTYANKNLLSSILFLSIPFLISALFLSRKWKITASILLFSIIVLLLIIKTRSVLIALTFFIIVFFVLSILNRKVLQDRIYRYYKILISSIVLIFILCFFYFSRSTYFDNLTSSNTASTRLIIWDNSIKMAKENFILGVGPGNWQIHFPKYGLDKFSSVVKNGLTTFQRPHNDFLWVFCEVGIIGLVAYTFFFFVALYYLFKLMRNSNLPEAKIVYSAFFTGIIGYAFISFVDFPLERIEHQLFFYLIISIVVANYHKIFYVSKSSIKTTKIPVFIILSFVPILFSFTVSISRFSGEYHTHKMYKNHHKANWNRMIIEAEKASSLFYSIDPMSVPLDWYKGVALFSLGKINDAETCFEQAYIIHPYNIHVLNNLASCYESNAKHKKAKEFYLKALSISSEFEEARLNLSAVYYNLKEYQKAFNEIDKCNFNDKNYKYYEVYLPAILYSWMELLLNKQNDENTIKAITEIRNSKDVMLQYYVASKNNNVTFEEYILKNLNKKDSK